MGDELNATLGPLLPRFILDFPESDFAAIRRSLSKYPIDGHQLDGVIDQTDPDAGVAAASGEGLELLAVRISQVDVRRVLLQAGTCGQDGGLLEVVVGEGDEQLLGILHVIRRPGVILLRVGPGQIVIDACGVMIRWPLIGLDSRWPPSLDGTTQRSKFDRDRTPWPAECRIDASPAPFEKPKPKPVSRKVSR